MKALSTYFSKKNFAMRALVDQDVGPLVAIINDAYSYQDAVKDEPRTSPNHLRKRASEVNFYVITKDDAIVACVYTNPQRTSLHFGLLIVIPEYRGTGLAQAIMKTIEETCHTAS